MKKLFAMMLCAIALCACSDDDEKNPVAEIDYAALLVGEWVYDAPKEGVWETMKFTSSGVFYFSNYNNNVVEFENENVPGRYFVNGNKVTGVYKLNEVTQMNFDMQILEINAWEFTAKFNDSGLTFTYARLLDSETVEYNETVTPNYQNLMRGAEIVAYASHDTGIATVDAVTGEVTGVSSGRTYIDIITKEGTAVIEIKVKGLLEYKYDEFIGAERSEIYEVFGNSPAADESGVMVYQNISEDIQYMRVGFNEFTGKVSDIRLYISNTDAAFATAMTGYLGRLYTVYEKGTTDTYKAYINDKEYDNASAGITWDIPNLQITYVALNHDLFTDYSPLLGKSKADVKKMMDNKQPFSEDEFMLAYGISDGKIDLMCCYFTFDFVDTYDTVQAVITRLNDSLSASDVHKYLSKKYVFMESESTSAEKVYVTKDAMTAVFYYIEDAQVFYLPLVSSTNSNVSLNRLSRYYLDNE